MDNPDLSFYQSVLKGVGISHVLIRQEQSQDKDREKLTFSEAGPGALNPVESRSSSKAAMILPAKEDHEFPSMLRKYNRPAYSVWTYFCLPEDMSADFTCPRGELINSMLKNLRWTLRTYTFWPLSVLKGKTIVSDVDLFFRGLTLIRPAYVFVFGSRAFKAILKDREYVYGLQAFNEHRLIVLPGLDALLPDNRILKMLAWNMLKQYSPPQY